MEQSCQSNCVYRFSFINYLSYLNISSNGIVEEGEVFFGLVDPDAPKQILDIRPFLQMTDNEDVDFHLIRKLNNERKSRYSFGENIFFQDQTFCNFFVGKVGLKTLTNLSSLLI